MKGIARWILRIAVALWMIVLLFVTVEWFRTYGGGDVFWRESEWESSSSEGGRVIELSFLRGVMSVTYARRDFNSFSPVRWLTGSRRSVQWRHENGSTIATIWETLFGVPGARFAWGSEQWTYGWEFQASIPLSVAELFLFAPPVGAHLLWKRSRRRRTRLAGGLCLRCGYDLRASIERCPECGTKIPPSTAGVEIKSV